MPGILDNISEIAGRLTPGLAIMAGQNPAPYMGMLERRRQRPGQEQEKELRRKLLSEQLQSLSSQRARREGQSAAAQELRGILSGTTQPQPVPEGQQGPPGPAPGLQGILQNPEFLSALSRMQGGMPAMLGILGKKPTEPKIIKDAAGHQRYATGPLKGQRAFPDVKAGASDFTGKGYKSSAQRVLDKYADAIENGTATQAQIRMYENAARSFQGTQTVTHPVTGVPQKVTPALLPRSYPRTPGMAKRERARAPQAVTTEPLPPKGKTLWGLAGEGNVAGPGSWASEKYGRVAPWVGLEGAPQATKARQTFRTETNTLLRALSINPRFPVGEMNRLREEIDIKPAFWDSQESLQGRMQAVDTSLRRRLAYETRDSKDATLPAKSRQEAARAAKDIRNFLAVLGVPKGGAPSSASDSLKNKYNLSPTD